MAEPDARCVQPVIQAHHTPFTPAAPRISQMRLSILSLHTAKIASFSHHDERRQRFVDAACMKRLYEMTR